MCSLIPKPLPNFLSLAVYVIFMQLKMVQAWNINAGQGRTVIEFGSSHTAELGIVAKKNNNVS